MEKNHCTCRFLRKDLKNLAYEFNMNLEELYKPVSKKEKYKKFKVCKDVYLIKYFVLKITRNYETGLQIKTIMYNYYIQGERQKVFDVLSKTCGIKARGCYFPLLEDKVFKF